MMGMTDRGTRGNGLSRRAFLNWSRELDFPDLRALNTA